MVFLKPVNFRFARNRVNPKGDFASGHLKT
jgi:hypothetical protein